MPPPLHGGEVRVIKTDLGFVARAHTKQGYVFFYLSELTFSRQSVDAVMEIEVISKTGIRPSFVQRIDLRSSSAVRALVTDLNNAYGNKKEENGYNWSLILNTVIAEISRAIQKTQTVQSILDISFEEPRFLLSPFLQEHAPNLVFAQSEVGKTFFVQRMVLSLASGKDFMGYPSPSGKKTLYIDYEDSISAFASRLHKLCRGMAIEYKEIALLVSYYKPTGSLRNNIEIIKKMVKDNQIDLVVIDAGGDAAGGSPSDEEKVIDLFNALEELPTTKLMLHHEPKYVQNEAAAFYGSMYWKARSRVAWRLEVESEEDDSKLIKMTIQKKSNLPPISALYYRQKFIGVTLDEIFDSEAGQQFIPAVTLCPEDINTIGSKNTDELIIEALEKENLTQAQLSQLIDKDRSVVVKRTSFLKEKGIIEPVKSGKGILWRIKA